VKQLVQVTVPKTKSDLLRALSGTSVKRLRVDVVQGSKLDDSTLKTVVDWRRGKNRVLIVLLDLGADQ
jgi:hypothetical protein